MALEAGILLNFSLFISVNGSPTANDARYGHPGDFHFGPHGHLTGSGADAYHQTDYAVVGGGPAGLVLAEQLSQNPDVSVILLEEGPDGMNEPKINVPAYAPLNIAPVSDQYIWNYTSQPDPNLGGRTPKLQQGQTLGGGTAVNYMGYCRGAPSVFDDWANAGDPELRWDALLGDFEATSHFDASPSDHRQVVNKTVYEHGPIDISCPAVLNGWDPYYFDALKAGLNLPEVDLNDRSALGVILGMETIKSSNRTRSYALPAYGWQMAGRPNVQMLHGALVSHIGFDGKRATNVTYSSVSDNQTYTVSAREIIVSAGAIGSPKLLMLSGVGPKEHLRDLSIPLVQDVPDIGSNLYDHHVSSVEAEVISDVQTIWQLLYNATDTALTEAEYKANSTGPLGNSDTGSFALARIPDTVFEGLNNTHYTSLPADRGQLLYQYSTAAFVAGSANISIVSPFVALVQPEGTGYIRLNSSDFQEPPLNYSNYYGSAADKAAILYGYKRLRAILHSDTLAPVVVREVFPGTNVNRTKISSKRFSRRGEEDTAG
ncbi:hypothetical protein B0A55_12572 [Friedmanniomyces simplex]|uniref:Glucose-methanol-choline oxidoreductase N-terminal domain-containing protein n=1 Tax=Friedmanniomyces simplex TaxID=329884 RepID=A0A4U0WGM3_9PEZI|nr:hypothetical protein B0A55_12572 [Friedmanniomyces simplex]